MTLTRREFARCAGAAALAAGCRRRVSTVAAGLPQGTNVLLLILDTVGAASVSSFDHADSLTPAIDRLAATGVAFRQCYASSPWTKPSFATMFTGLMPNRCAMSGVTSVLDPRFQTLAAAFAAKGFQTAAVVSHLLIASRSGLAHGFDHFDESLTRSVRPNKAISSHLVTDQAIRWLDTRDNKPFFLTAHYFDPHSDYQHHPAFDRTSGYRGPLRPGMPIDDVHDFRPSMQSADIAYLNDLYREEIAYTDHHLGRLLDHLVTLGIDRDTLIVLVADHGEEFMQHGWIGHTVGLYNGMIHVPLLFRLPRHLRPGGCRAPVSIADLWPTLAALCGLELPPYPLDGVSLLPLLNDPANDGDAGRMIFSEVDYMPQHARSVADELITLKTALAMDRHKLIHDRRRERWMLFDLANDPTEQSNLTGQRPFERALRRELTRWEKTRNPIRVDAPDFLKPDEIEKLKSLGYLR